MRMAMRGNCWDMRKKKKRKILIPNKLMRKILFLFMISS
jgi:hypothetical protein